MRVFIEYQDRSILAQSWSKEGDNSLNRQQLVECDAFRYDISRGADFTINGYVYCLKQLHAQICGRQQSESYHDMIGINVSVHLICESVHLAKKPSSYMYLGWLKSYLVGKQF